MRRTKTWPLYSTLSFPLSSSVAVHAACTKSGVRLIRSGLSSYINSSFGPRGPRAPRGRGCFGRERSRSLKRRSALSAYRVIGWWRVSGPKKNVRVRFPGILSEDMSPFTLLSGDTETLGKSLLCLCLCPVAPRFPLIFSQCFSTEWWYLTGVGENKSLL